MAISQSPRVQADIIMGTQEPVQAATPHVEKLVAGSQQHLEYATAESGGMAWEEATKESNNVEDTADQC